MFYNESMTVLTLRKCVMSTIQHLVYCISSMHEEWLHVVLFMNFKGDMALEI